MFAKREQWGVIRRAVAGIQHVAHEMQVTHPVPTQCGPRWNDTELWWFCEEVEARVSAIKNSLRELEAIKQECREMEDEISRQDAIDSEIEAARQQDGDDDGGCDSAPWWQQ